MEEVEDEEGEEGTALTWVTGWTHDVVCVSWLKKAEMNTMVTMYSGISIRTPPLTEHLVIGSKLL